MTLEDIINLIMDTADAIDETSTIVFGVSDDHDADKIDELRTAAESLQRIDEMIFKLNREAN